MFHFLLLHMLTSVGLPEFALTRLVYFSPLLHPQSEGRMEYPLTNGLSVCAEFFSGTASTIFLIFFHEVKVSSNLKSHETLFFCWRKSRSKRRKMGLKQGFSNFMKN